MKVFGLLLLLVGVLMQSILMTSAVDIDDDPEIMNCAKCFQGKNTKAEVCGLSEGIYASYFNMCELKCAGARFTHPGECKYEELIKNRPTA